MKNVVRILLLLVVFSVAFAGSTNIKKYEFKSAIVEYKLSGITKGTKTKYIADYGAKEADYINSTSSIMGQTRKTNTITIQDGFDIIDVDLETNIGSKRVNDMLKAMVEEGKDIGEFGREMLVKIGGKKINKTEKVLGKTCEIWELQEGIAKIWVWGNLTLKTKASIMGMTSEEVATSIKIDVSIPDSKFEAPKGITYKDYEELQRGMGGGMGF